MKAFFGALLLTLMAGAAGVLAAVELHEFRVARDDPGAIGQAQTAEEEAQAASPPIRRRVNYPTRDGAAETRAASSGI